MKLYVQNKTSIKAKIKIKIKITQKHNEKNRFVVRDCAKVRFCQRFLKYNVCQENNEKRCKEEHLSAQQVEERFRMVK